MNKTCARCSSSKPSTFEFFSNANSTLDGLSSWCRTCYKEYNKERSYPSKYIPNGKPKGRPRKNPLRIDLPNKPGRPKSVPDPSIPEGFKKCTKCLTLKEAIREFFNEAPKTPLGLSADCKECRSKYQKEQRAKDPEKYRNSVKRSYEKHKEKRDRAAKKWRQENKPLIAAAARKKRKEDPIFRMAANLRTAVKDCLSYKDFRKGSKLTEYLGCNSQEFKVYIESLFEPGMTWDSYGNKPGQWNLDHTIPLTSAKTVEEAYKLSHYLNIKPMWAKLNFIKNDRSPEEWAAYKLENGIPDPELASPAPKKSFWDK